MGIDIIGNIAIFDDDSTKKQAQTFIKNNKHITTVLKKASIHKGKYRTQKLKHLAGIKTKETIHKESNCIFKLDVEKCYFSPRSGNERIRIKNLVKKNESVLVLFDGISPFSIIIAKHTKAKEIDAIEINPICHKYAKENLKLNKITNINLYKGDVRKVLPKLKKKYNRIIMPLPKQADKYLDLAKKHSKKGTIIHLYQFFKEKDINKKHAKQIISKYLKKFTIQKITKAGVYSPHTYRVAIDIKVQ